MAGIRDFLYRAHISDAALTHVSPTWQYLDHTPEFNRLYFIRSGQGMVRIGDREFYPVADDLVLLPAHVRQSFCCTGPDTYTKYWCRFTCPAGELDLFNLISLPTVLRSPRPEEFELRFATLVAAFSGTDLLSHLRAQAALWELIASLVELAGIKEFLPHAAEDPRLRPVLRFVDENLSSPITLAELAARAGLQETYFVGYFKKHQGLPPMRWVQARRMERAREYLTTSDLLVGEVGRRAATPNSTTWAVTQRATAESLLFNT